MKRILTVVCIALLLIVTPVNAVMAQESKGTIHDKAQKLASVIVDGYGVAGMQYAVMDNGSIALSGSAGVSDRATGAPITTDTMYGIGSVSKMYVTAATMMLADAKLVDLDEPLTTYIEDFRMEDERYRDITPRMLLNHSSGLYGTHYENSMLLGDNDTQAHDDLLAKLRSERLKSDPGAFSVYCNDGFTLLEILVERVSGLSYTEFLDQYISSPLGLNSTKTPIDSFDRERLAKTYFPPIDRALPVENANIIGTGGLYSTAEEVVMFADVLMGNRPDLLSEAAAEAMQSHEYRKGIWVEEDANIFNYGLGWDSVSLAPFSDYGIAALSKGGDTIMYHATLIALPDYDISIAALSSGGSSFYNSVFATELLLEYLYEKEIIADIHPDQTLAPPVKAEMPSEFRSYSGLYGMVGETAVIDIADGEFALPPQMGGLIPEQTYVYTGEGRFTSSDGIAAVSFVEETNGKTYLKLDGYLNFPGLGQLRMVSYEYQKLDVNPLDQSVREVWDARNGDKYYALDEKISSAFYLTQEVLNKHISVDAEYGYANATKIVDGNHSANAVEIPNMNGRDAFDLRFYQQGGVEYLEAGGQNYISEDAIPAIYGGSSSICTIQSEGQARWYIIDDTSADKTMTVSVPKSDGFAGFAVYDADGMLVYFSIAFPELHEHSVTLPNGGTIVFGGEAGDVFGITMEDRDSV